MISSPPSAQGLTICDATSACFAQTLDWPKLDVVTFSWQKALGGEAAHGVLILSPRAVARLESYSPPWPMPKLFRMTKGGKLNAEIFDGATINTPSMLCVEDYLDALKWAASIGGLQELKRRADQNLGVLAKPGSPQTPWVGFLAEDRRQPLQHLRLPESCRPRRSPLLPADAQADFAKRLASRAGEGGRRSRHRRLPRRAAGSAHLVRRHGGHRRPPSPHSLARLGLHASRVRRTGAGLTFL